MDIPISSYRDVTSYLFPKRRGDLQYNLEKISIFLKRLGDPHHTLRGGIVTGSKGKGSVTAMMHSILRASGNRAGRFTSPHVIRLNERIMVDREISDEELISLTRMAYPVIEDLDRSPETRLSFFEIITGIGLRYFSDMRCDAVILEVGMGGRLDATNMLKNDVAVITPIELEHIETLGRTIPAIAREKAGIIKSGCDVVVNCNDDALAPIRERCRETGSTLWMLGEGFSGIRKRFDIRGEWFDYISEDMRLEDLYIPLHGIHEVENAACAIMGCELLSRKTGVTLTEKGVRDGLASVRWPARIQIITVDPLLVIDCAHTPGSAQALINTLGELFPGKKYHFVAGILADKDIRGVFTQISRAAEFVHLSPVPSPRFEPPEKVAHILRELGIPHDIHTSSQEALACAQRSSKSVVVTGSIFLAGEILALIDNRPSPGSVE